MPNERSGSFNIQKLVVLTRKSGPFMLCCARYCASNREELLEASEIRLPLVDSPVSLVTKCLVTKIFTTNFAGGQVEHKALYVAVAMTSKLTHASVKLPLVGVYVTLPIPKWKGVL